MKIGEKGAKARKDINLTQDQLAGLLEVTYMMKEMMTTYDYTLDDTILVLKDLLYKAYLDKQKEED